MIPSEEIELKLEMPSGEIAAFRNAPALGDPQRRPLRQVTVYFDTPAGRLRKSGYSLRVRRKGGAYFQTVKHRGFDSGGFSSRPEWETRITQPKLDLAALRVTPVAELLTRRELKRLDVVSETRASRTTWLILRGESEIELILDEGEVISNGRREPICEVELELKTGCPADLFGLARDLGAHATLRMGVMSKSERGFRLLEGRTAAARKAEKVRLRESMSIAGAFAVIVQSCLRHFRLNEPLVAGKRNAAALHQARVAMRRLRSALTLFKPAVPDPEFDRIRSELRWFTGQLGEARNLDVIIAAQSTLEPRADPDTLAQLRAARRDAYARVRSALGEPRLPRLILDLVAWAEAGDWRMSDAAAAPIPPFARGKLDNGWKRVRKRGRDIGAQTPEERHRRRIEIKKLRYAAEFFAALTPKEARRHQKAFLGELQSLQETLGQLNDLETTRQLAPHLLERDEAQVERESARLVEQARQGHQALVELGHYWR